MRPDGVRIQGLVWRTFTPAIVIMAMALGALVYSRLHATIIDGFSRKLITTSALTAALVDPADHDWLLTQARTGEHPDLEADPRYRRNVEPMRAIRRDLGLTYLYSQVVSGAKTVIYVLDATQGDEHSALGATDELPADTMAGLRRTNRDGSIYVSPIQYQEKWGLLKTAAAPLRAPDGRIAATVGADVNISVIQVATQNALFASALIGVASLLACALATLMILRYVAQPIEELKADALRIAAGDRSPPQALRAPREVSALRTALGDLATHLIAAMRQARVDTTAQDHTRNLAMLESLLAGAPRVSVLSDTPEHLGLWIDAGPDTPEARLRRQAMAGLGRRLAADAGLAARWVEFADADGLLLVVDRGRGEVVQTGGQPLGLRVDGEGGPPTPAPRTLRPGQTLAVVLPDGEVPIAWEARA